MEFSELVKARYSCKNFDGRPIEKAQLDAILEPDAWRLPQRTCRSRGFMWFSRRKGWRKSIR